MSHPARTVGVLLFVAWVLAALYSTFAAKEVLAPPATRPSGETPVVMGSASCAARGCHGGLTTDVAGDLLDPDWHNACSYWQRFDRHANAYRVLFNERSQRMVELLAAGGPVVPAYKQERCLACHTTPAIASMTASAANQAPIRTLAAEGVSCDACHTQPGRSTGEWFEPHKAGWTNDSLASCYSSLGMRWLGDTRVRAEVCAGCHVGASAENGLPLREVNHDLIAAGHPRLNFEYSTYLALMPPHWAAESMSPTGQPLSKSVGHDVEEWYVGQIETGIAGLELLADQATRAEGIWPEFTAYNCYSCHFDFLKNVPPGTEWRQHRAETAAKSRTGGPGVVPWNGANLTLPIRRLLTDNESFTTGYIDLAQAMSKPGAKGKAVAGPAESLAQICNGLTATPPVDLQGTAAGLVLVRELRLDDSALNDIDWDDAAQLFYAIQAANRSRHRVASSKSLDRDEIDTTLQELAKLLRFPRDGKEYYNSPLDYDPKQVAAILKRIPPLFEDWYAKAGLTPPR